MKKLLILTVTAAAVTLMGTADTVQADHCRSGGSSFGVFGSSFGPSYGYSYQPAYTNYGYRPSYSSYGYRPSYYGGRSYFGGGSAIGFSGRGFSISIGSGFRPSYGGRGSHFGHRH